MRQKRTHRQTRFAAAALASTLVGCAPVLIDRISDADLRDISYCDLCGLQDIHDSKKKAFRQLKGSELSVVDEENHLQSRVMRFEVLDRAAFVKLLDRNYDRVPEELSQASRITVEGRVIERLDDYNMDYEDEIRSSKRFIPRSAAERNVTVQYVVDGKEESFELGISECLTGFFFDQKVYGSRKEAVDRGIIDPKSDCAEFE